MATTGVIRATTRVAMVWPGHAIVECDIVDLRAEPRDDAELVDQAHFGERLRLLAERGEWRYVQGEDQYFGWVRGRSAPALIKYPRGLLAVAVPLADVHELPDPDSPVIARFPAGALLPSVSDARAPSGWHLVPMGSTDPVSKEGFLSTGALVEVADLPHRYPTADDLLRTAEAFLGVPYLWGGTTALGMDCSGFVQQVYRLNGVALPRDADQQAVLGRRVEEARAGDLLFFGAGQVTHVALATSRSEFIHAPQVGGAVERSQLGGDRRLLAIRRYLPGVSMEDRE